ncbi:hypothetical protein HK100_007055 [Physocladia obscura]|uniref:Uncharacterized protein n=1 Tax=Physocladia obscura TaxID=109957 RepID=A0AAD5T6Q1_9FUNG|nr:hypothetical protein HK100_007055 [Physocladia obscura]
MFAANIKTLKRVLSLVPSATGPSRRLPLGERLLVTLGAAAVFGLLGQMRLYGVGVDSASSRNDALLALRASAGGNALSLLEFGAAPLVVGGVAVQLLLATKALTANHDVKDERLLLAKLAKAIALVVVVVQAALYVAPLALRPLPLPLPVLFLLLIQLLVAPSIVILADELIQKGWGLGSGYALFIALHLSENAVWNAFSFASVKTNKGIQSHDINPQFLNLLIGTEYTGSIIALFHLLLTRRDKFRALKEAFYRKNLPNISGLIIQLSCYAATIYAQNVRYEIPLQHSKARGQFTQKFPLKLLYTSNLPLLAISTFLGYYSFISQSLFSIFPENILVRVLGVWKVF